MSNTGAVAHYLKEYFDTLWPITRIKLVSELAVCDCTVCKQIRKLLEENPDVANGIQNSPPRG